MSKVAKWIGYTLLAVMMLVMLFFLVSPHLAGISFFHVYSGSMSPDIPVGSLLMVHSVDPQGIDIGEVITFRTPAKPNEVVVHRVVEVISNEGSLSFRTAGDANGSPDKYAVPAENVVGKVWFHLPFLGYLIPFLRTKFGFLLLVCLPALILVSLEVRNIILELKAMGKLPHRRLSPVPVANNPTNLRLDVIKTADEEAVTNINSEATTPQLTTATKGVTETKNKSDMEVEAARIVADIMTKIRASNRNAERKGSRLQPLKVTQIQTASYLPFDGNVIFSHHL